MNIWGSLIPVQSFAYMIYQGTRFHRKPNGGLGLIQTQAFARGIAGPIISVIHWGRKLTKSCPLILFEIRNFQVPAPSTNN